MSAGTDPATAARNWYTPHYYTGAVKWTMTASDRMLFEAGYSTNVEIYTNHSVDPTIPEGARHTRVVCHTGQDGSRSGDDMVCRGRYVDRTRALRVCGFDDLRDRHA